jgi:hypothetical protein
MATWVAYNLPEVNIHHIMALFSGVEIVRPIFTHALTLDLTLPTPTGKTRREIVPHQEEVPVLVTW